MTERDDIFGLVNNAGIATPNLIEEFDNEIYEKVMDLNATAVAELTAAVVPVLIKNKQGRVVNISSELFWDLRRAQLIQLQKQQFQVLPGLGHLN